MGRLAPGCLYTLRRMPSGSVSAAATKGAIRMGLFELDGSQHDPLSVRRLRLAFWLERA